MAFLNDLGTSRVAMETLLLWEKWSENFELLPGFKPRKICIQGQDTSRYTTEELNYMSQHKVY